jgi:hypothetical protein
MKLYNQKNFSIKINGLSDGLPESDNWESATSPTALIQIIQHWFKPSAVWNPTEQKKIWS